MSGEDAGEQSALNELKEPGTGSKDQCQHASPGAPTEQNAVTGTQCRQDYLPTPDLNNSNKVPVSNNGTLEEQRIEKRPKVLHAKVITEEETVHCCQRICTTLTENITIRISEDGKPKIVRCTEKPCLAINLF